MTTTADRGTRRLRAKIIGVGLDGESGLHRVLKGKECLVFGGSEETHADLLETMLRLDLELERMGQDLGEVHPDELADLAWRIDLPELEVIARQLQMGLQHADRSFDESTAQELTDMARGVEP